MSWLPPSTAVRVHMEVTAGGGTNITVCWVHMEVTAGGGTNITVCWVHMEVTAGGGTNITVCLVCLGTPLLKSPCHFWHDIITLIVDAGSNTGATQSASSSLGILSLITNLSYDIIQYKLYNDNNSQCTLIILSVEHQ